MFSPLLLVALAAVSASDTRAELRVDSSPVGWTLEPRLESASAGHFRYELTVRTDGAAGSRRTRQVNRVRLSAGGVVDLGHIRIGTKEGCQVRLAIYRDDTLLAVDEFVCPEAEGTAQERGEGSRKTEGGAER